MATMIINKQNVFTQFSTILSLLDSNAEIKISYFPNTGENNNSQDSYDKRKKYNDGQKSFENQSSSSSKYTTKRPFLKKSTSKPVAKWYETEVTGAKRFSDNKKSFSESKSKSSYSSNKKGNAGRAYKKAF